MYFMVNIYSNCALFKKMVMWKDLESNEYSLGVRCGVFDGVLILFVSRVRGLEVLFPLVVSVVCIFSPLIISSLRCSWLTFHS